MYQLNCFLVILLLDISGFNKLTPFCDILSASLLIAVLWAMIVVATKSFYKEYRSKILIVTSVKSVNYPTIAFLVFPIFSISYRIFRLVNDWFDKTPLCC